MGLAQSIVIVNEYTVRTSSGKGSRGSSPGRYAVRYMARSSATQVVSPVKKRDLDTFITRYMAREDAVERLKNYDDDIEVSMGTSAKVKEKNTSPDKPDDAATKTDNSSSVNPMLHHNYVTKADVRDEFKKAQQLGGVAFCPGDVSMSHEKLIARSDGIQQAFDEGKTVLKTVISFEHDYLVKNNIVDPDVNVSQPGDYRGEIDEMKLRLAIMSGLDRMGRLYYEDLDYVGVIQVDTEHVHAHIAMVDKGTGTLTSDGTQRGKISLKARNQLRRGIDNYLDENQRIKHYSATLSHERLNVVSFIKSWAVSAIIRETGAQYIVSMLPDDERLWRAGTHNASMAKVDELVRGLVTDRLADPQSPMAKAMHTVNDYATHRQLREGFDDEYKQKIIDDSEKKIIDQCVNGVYSVLSAIPKDMRHKVHTPLMSIMSMDTDELYRSIIDDQGSSSVANKTHDLSTMGLNEFGMRMRIYASRQRYHTDQEKVYQEAIDDWQRVYDAGIASNASTAMRDHFEVEKDYHGRAAQKYNRILGFNTVNPRWEQQWERVARLGDTYLELRALRKDKSIARLDDENEAEELGMKIYHQSGGGGLSKTGVEGRQARREFDERIDRARENYEQALAALRRSWAIYGVHIVALDDEDGTESQDNLKLQSASVSSAGEFNRPLRRLEQPEGNTSDTTIPTQYKVVSRPEYVPEVVKGVDLHDVAAEIVTPINVGKKVSARYSSFTAIRRRAIDRARQFLIDSGQVSQVGQLSSAERDISRAEDTVEVLRSTGGVLTSTMNKVVERISTKLNRRRHRNIINRAAQSMARSQHDELDVANVVDTDTEMAAEQETEQTTEQTADTRPSGRSYEVDDRVRSRINRRIDKVATDYVRTHIIAQETAQQRMRDIEQSRSLRYEGLN